MSSSEELLCRVNSDLARNERGVRVESRGGRLSLVATLPCKPGETTRSGRKQYRIATGLGTSIEGVEDAEDLALELSREMRRGEFRWSKWANYGSWAKGGRSGSVETATAIADLKAAADERWIAKGRSEDWRKRAWQNEYVNPCLGHLTGERLEQGAILDNIRRYQPNTQSRLLVVDISRRLVELAQKNYPGQVAIEIDWRSYRGDYSATKTTRTVPTDDQAIIDAINLLPYAPWRRVYATMAIFGVRNHECWHCDVVEAGEYWVADVGSDTKTGARRAFPIVCNKPELSPFSWEAVRPWFEIIKNTPLPEIKAVQNKDYGDRTSRYFRKYKMPFEPYGLRHAAIKRAVDLLGIPIPVVARSMGNSVAMTERVYRAQASPQEQAELWAKLLG